MLLFSAKANPSIERTFQKIVLRVLESLECVIFPVNERRMSIGATTTNSWRET